MPEATRGAIRESRLGVTMKVRLGAGWKGATRTMALLGRTDPSRDIVIYPGIPFHAS